MPAFCSCPAYINIPCPTPSAKSRFYLCWAFDQYWMTQWRALWVRMSISLPGFLMDPLANNGVIDVGPGCSETAVANRFGFLHMFSICCVLHRSIVSFFSVLEIHVQNHAQFTVLLVASFDHIWLRILVEVMVHARTPTHLCFSLYSMDGDLRSTNCLLLWLKMLKLDSEENC